jgi:uncharacterized membrane protein (UPF0127 family)
MRRAVVVAGSRRALVDVAERRRERVRGLIGSLPGRGLLLPRTRSVHTFGMRRPIDVVLLDARLRVVHVIRMVPGRILLPRPRVRHVLELDRAPFVAGDALTIVEDQAGQPPSPADPVTTH